MNSTFFIISLVIQKNWKGNISNKIQTNNQKLIRWYHIFISRKMIHYFWPWHVKAPAHNDQENKVKQHVMILILGCDSLELSCSIGLFKLIGELDLKEDRICNCLFFVKSNHISKRRFTGKMFAIPIKITIKLFTFQSWKLTIWHMTNKTYKSSNFNCCKMSDFSKLK